MPRSATHRPLANRIRTECSSLSEQVASLSSAEIVVLFVGYAIGCATGYAAGYAVGYILEDAIGYVMVLIAATTMADDSMESGWISAAWQRG